MSRFHQLHLLKPYEWLGIAVALVLIGVIYGLLIYPAAASLAELPKLKTARAAAAGQLEDIRRQVQATSNELTTGRLKLDQLGGSPPSASQKDLQIARVTALADKCQVRINQFMPLQSLDAQDHRAVIVEFIGQGSFPDIQRFFAQLESTVDFVDVTHFAVETLNSERTSDCMVTWSCRINTLKPQAAETTSPTGRGSEAKPTPGQGGGP